LGKGRTFTAESGTKSEINFYQKNEVPSLMVQKTVIINIEQYKAIKLSSR